MATSVYSLHVVAPGGATYQKTLWQFAEVKAYTQIHRHTHTVTETEQKLATPTSPAPLRIKKRQLSSMLPKNL